MNKVYLITQIVKGPAGHGEPGREYQTLKDDGDWGIGEVYPAFISRKSAEKFAESEIKYRYTILEVPIHE